MRSGLSCSQRCAGRTDDVDVPRACAKLAVKAPVQMTVQQEAAFERPRVRDRRLASSSPSSMVLNHVSGLCSG